MFEIGSYPLSPVHVQDKIKSMFSPIIYSDAVYIIKDKFLYEILSRINLLQEFILNTRKNGHNNTTKWLYSKGLLNEGFLENISQYRINNTGIKKISDYRVFLKDLNNKPIISPDLIKSIFSKAILFSYLLEKKDELNACAEKELDFIEQELSSIKDDPICPIRREFFKKNVFRNILENFLSKVNAELGDNLQILENININLVNQLEIDDLDLCTVGDLVSYKNFKFSILNPTHQECLKKDTIIKFNISLNKQFSQIIKLEEYFKFLINNLYLFVQAKLKFDKMYISQLFNHDKDFKYINIINALENANTNISSTENRSSSNVSLRDTRISEKHLILENYKQLMLQANYTIEYYNFISNANLFICSNADLNKLICTLNLEEYNIERINSIIFGKKSKVESELVKLYYKESTFSYQPVGFMKLNF